MADDRVPRDAAVGFDRAAAAYERARPSYPDDAVRLLLDRLGLGPGSRVCDLAAGTGKLTRLLATPSLGLTVTAVEPVAGMREQLLATAPGVAVHDGTAESIGLPDGSFDAVTVAQAFHWFRVDAALADIRRVLAPGGGVAIVFNRRDEHVPWIAEWSRIIGWHQQRVAQYEHTDWTGLLEGAGFTAPTYDEVRWNQPIDRALLADRVRSVSYVAVLPADEQDEYVRRVVALTDGFEEPFDLAYTTMLWTARAPG